MFESEDDRMFTSEPEQEEGSVLQRYLSQLGMPASSGASELNGFGFQAGASTPRYYGAPPDHVPPYDSMADSKVEPGDQTDRLNFILKMASGAAQPFNRRESQRDLAPEQGPLQLLPQDKTNQANRSARNSKPAQPANATGTPVLQGPDLDKLVRWDPLADSRAQMEDDRMLTEQSSRSPRSFPARDPKTLPQASRRWRPVSSDMSEFAKIAVPNADPNHLRNYLPYVVDALRERGFDLNNPEVLRYALATINAENDAFRSEDEGLSYGPKGKANTSSREATPFDNYEGRNGNTEPGDGERYKGRGLVQLTGRGEYTDMTHKLGMDQPGMDLINHPELANDPQIAARILAQHLIDHMGNLQMLRDSPDAAASLKTHADELKDVHDADPQYKESLKNDPLVKARAVVNGGFRGSKPLKNLPNGLSRFLPAEAFGQQYQEIVRAEQYNPDLTVGKAARIFAAVDPFGGEAAYLEKLQRQLGLDPDTTRLSELTPDQKQIMDRAQIQYVRQVESELDKLSQAKGKVKKAEAAARKAEEERKRAAGQAQGRPANDTGRATQGQQPAQNPAPPNPRGQSFPAGRRP